MHPSNWDGNHLVGFTCFRMPELKSTSPKGELRPAGFLPDKDSQERW